MEIKVLTLSMNPNSASHITYEVRAKLVLPNHKFKIHNLRDVQGFQEWY